MMEVVSPTRVAAPCRLEDTEMQISMATGDIFSFLQMASPTGAIMRTVATLSTKADTMPANRDMATATHITLGVFLSIRSARRLGILDSMNRNTVPMVPASIMRTFQSMALAIRLTGMMPRATYSTAETNAT